MLSILFLLTLNRVMTCSGYLPRGSTPVLWLVLYKRIKSCKTTWIIYCRFPSRYCLSATYTLSQKLAPLNIPDEIYNWLVTFLNGRSHVTRYAGRTFSIACINASVVQGSVIYPSSYDVLASDLHPMSPQNIILKYADDTYLVVPSSNRHTVPSELNHISAWATNNNLKLNVTKSRELIIHGRARFDPLPHPGCPSCRGPSRP